MPCVADFAIMGTLDKNKDYSMCEIESYSCVTIDDDALNDWWERLTSMKTYFHSFKRPETALARCGITLIPPESLDLFYDIVANDTSAEFVEQTPALLDIISKAKEENKFIIHFGV